MKRASVVQPILTLVFLLALNATFLAKPFQMTYDAHGAGTALTVLGVASVVTFWLPLAAFLWLFRTPNP